MQRGVERRWSDRTAVDTRHVPVPVEPCAHRQHRAAVAGVGPFAGPALDAVAQAAHRCVVAVERRLQPLRDASCIRAPRGGASPAAIASVSRRARPGSSARNAAPILTSRWPRPRPWSAHRRGACRVAGRRACRRFLLGHRGTVAQVQQEFLDQAIPQPRSSSAGSARTRRPRRPRPSPAPETVRGFARRAKRLVRFQSATSRPAIRPAPAARTTACSRCAARRVVHRRPARERGGRVAEAHREADALACAHQLHRAVLLGRRHAVARAAQHVGEVVGADRFDRRVVCRARRRRSVACLACLSSRIQQIDRFNPGFGSRAHCAFAAAPDADAGAGVAATGRAAGSYLPAYSASP